MDSKNTFLPVWARIFSFLFVFSLIVLSIGYHYGGRTGLFISTILLFVFHALIFFYSNASGIELIKRLDIMDSHSMKYNEDFLVKIQGQDPWRLRKTIDIWSDKLKIEAPIVYVIRSPSSHVFSLGNISQNFSLFITDTLLDKLTLIELEIILGQQMNFIRKRQNFLSTLSVTFALAIIGLGHMIDSIYNFILGNGRFFSHKKYFFYFSNYLILGLTKLSFPQRLFYSSDQLILLKNDFYSPSPLQAEILAKVLWKLEGLAKTSPLDIPLYFRSFFVVNPGICNSRIHPQIKDRLLQLVGYYPI